METHGLTGAQVATELRDRIREQKWRFEGIEEPLAGLTASCGVAANRRLAKICSDINKPDGQFVLPSDREAILQFVSTLPIRKVGGIGKVTERMLHEVA
jgi:DNA polymerase kappa